MIPPSGKGNHWWRWLCWFGNYYEEVRLGCVFCASESPDFFSWQPQTRAENMIARKSWRENKLLKTSYGDDLFFCLQIWPLPAFHLDPRAAKWHLSTRGHVGHFLLLSTKTEKIKVSKANALPKWDPALAALTIVIAAGMLRNGASTTELAAVGLMWLRATASEPPWYDVAFFL